MRHRLYGRTLSRTPAHRKAMRRNMAAALFEHGAIRTTEEKAKELRRFVEKIITAAREGTLHARRRVIRLLGDPAVFEWDEKHDRATKTGKLVAKLFDEIAPRYADRPGGYTRIIRLSERRIGDAGSQVVLQLVEEGSGGGGGGKSRRRRRAAKRHRAAAAAGAAKAPAGEKAPDQPVEEAEAEVTAEEQTEQPGEAEASEDAAEQASAEADETDEEDQKQGE